MEPVQLSQERREQILQLLELEKRKRREKIGLGEDYRLDWEALKRENRGREVSTKASIGEISSLRQRRQVSASHPVSAKASRSPSLSPHSPSLSLSSFKSFPVPPQLRSLPVSRSSSRTRDMDIERIRREVEQHWTFHPNLHLRSPSEGQFDPIDVVSLSWKDSLTRLSTPKTLTYTERNRLKLIKDNQELQQCTFRPVISPANTRLGHIDDRLFDDAVIRAKERQRIKAEHEELKAAECTFKPKIHGFGGEEKGKVPIYQRLTEVVRKREEEMRILTHKIAENEKNLKTYRPVINQKSEILAKKRHKTDVIQRMDSEHHLSEWRKSLLIQSNEQEEMKKCPFSPSLSPVLYQKPSKIDEIGRKIAELARKEREEACAFYPLVDKKSEEMVRKRRSEDWTGKDRVAGSLQYGDAELRYRIAGNTARLAQRYGGKEKGSGRSVPFTTEYRYSSPSSPFLSPRSTQPSLRLS